DTSRHMRFSDTISVFFLYGAARHRDLHSFPTRRSSDLPTEGLGEWASARRLLGFGRAPRIVRVGEAWHVGALLIADDAVYATGEDRKSTRLNSSHVKNSYAVFCLKKKKNQEETKKAAGN